jgi:hypothetical protein
MLKFLEDSGRGSERKLKLFACGCGRRYCCYLHKTPDKPLIDRHCREVIDAAERAIDGMSPPEELEAVWVVAARQMDQVVPLPIGLFRDLYAVMRGNWGSWAIRYDDTVRAAREGVTLDEAELRKGYAERGFQADLLRDLFGPLPFRLVTILPAWQTPEVMSLAQAAYDQRELPAGTLDLARLAVLADALEDAGCTDQTVLGHLRGPGPHVRGCWALDLLLRKE